MMGLVGSGMCIRDSHNTGRHFTNKSAVMRNKIMPPEKPRKKVSKHSNCLLYTSDAADQEATGVIPGGARLFKKKKNNTKTLDRRYPQSSTNHHEVMN
ncbi:hypothetical protein, partial [Pasteurella multocida]|uniref:hypothetical protein n=1 Tax=Pasteurella multocida TaxID=747 RepID=UPI002020CAE9